MKKKVLLTLLIILCLTFVTGCGNDLKDNTKIEETEGVLINNERVKLSYETSHLNMYYKTNITLFSGDTLNSVRNIRYINNGKTIFELNLVYFENKSIDEVMSASNYEISTKKINDLEYQYFEFEVNQKKGHTYVYNYNDTTYTISFTFEDDISDFEKEFMNNVYFK